MLTFISCAKTMASRCSLKVPEVTVPHFETEAVANALEMSQIPAAELEKLLRVNARIAAENRVRFHDFCSEDNHPMPAIGAYTGAVFKRILPKEFTADDFRYAQNHLRITSFLYGLLRPLDGIRLKNGGHVIKGHLSRVVDGEHDVGLGPHLDRIGHDLDGSRIEPGLLL